MYKKLGNQWATCLLALLSLLLVRGMRLRYASRLTLRRSQSRTTSSTTADVSVMRAHIAESTSTRRGRNANFKSENTVRLIMTRSDISYRLKTHDVLPQRHCIGVDCPCSIGHGVDIRRGCTGGGVCVAPIIVRQQSGSEMHFLSFVFAAAVLPIAVLATPSSTTGTCAPWTQSCMRALTVTRSDLGVLGHQQLGPCAHLDSRRGIQGRVLPAVRAVPRRRWPLRRAGHRLR
jgi:hypothetical protein